MNTPTHTLLRRVKACQNQGILHFQIKSTRNEVLNEWVIDSFDVEVDFGKTRDNPYSRRFDEYKEEFANENEQLANEYDLRIGRKMYALDDVWEKCEKFHDTTYSWHNEGFEEEERWKVASRKQTMNHRLSKVKPLKSDDTPSIIGRVSKEMDEEGRMIVQIRFRRRPPAKGVGLRVADSHTGNHHEDDFTPLETIQRSYSVIREKIPFELERETFEPETGTIFDAPPRSKKHIPNLLAKVITRIESWHKRFFNVRDSIIPAKYPQLLSEQNKLDLKSFKDKLPPNTEENPMEHGQQRLAIMAGGKEMAFRNFIYTEDDEDLAFLPKEPSPGFDRKCKTRGGSSRPPDKRKLASWSSTSHATRSKTSSSKDDALFLTVSDDDEGLPDISKLKDVAAYHLKISAITPPSWKNHLDNHMDFKLMDLHDH
ncbi:hypothetical protein Tco_0252309 [Tanacetum coccineum]